MWIIGLLLLALQTTTTAASDSRIDTLTLVLVVLFIAAMLGLSLAIRRQDTASPDELAMDRPLPARPEQPESADSAEVRSFGTAGHGGPALHRRVDRANAADRVYPESGESVPVWLQGVTIPSREASLAEATRVIEELLGARRNQDLATGIALYAPSARAALARSLGIGGEDSGADAVFDGDPPSLRSAEIVEATGVRMTVRATYSNRASETYMLVRIEDEWLIESIMSIR